MGRSGTRSLVGTRKRRGEVDGEDLRIALVGKGVVRVKEICRRRLRGDGQVLRRLKFIEELLDHDINPVSVLRRPESDVQRHHAQVVLLHQCSRQIGGTVQNDGELVHGPSPGDHIRVFKHSRRGAPTSRNG